MPDNKSKSLQIDWSCRKLRWSIKTNSVSSSLPYLAFNNFTITYKNKSTNSKTFSENTFPIFINSVNSFTELSNKIMPFFFLNQVVPDLKVIFIVQRSTYINDSVVEFSRALGADIISLEEYGQVLLTSVYTNLGSDTISPRWPLEDFNTSLQYLNIVIPRMHAFLKTIKISTNSLHNEKVFIFPGGKLNKLNQYYDALSFFKENGISLMESGVEISDPRDVLPELLHNVYNPGKALGFVKEVFESSDLLTGRIISEDIVKICEHVIDMGYRVIEDTGDNWEVVLSSIRGATDVIALAGLDALWLLNIQSNARAIVLDPYPNSHVIIPSNIVKLLPNSRTPVIIRDREFEEEVSLDKILHTLKKEEESLMKFNIVIPMAGQGSRFSSAGYAMPKPLILADGKTLAERSISSLGLSGKFIFITRSFDVADDNEKLTDVFRQAADRFIEVRVDTEHLGAAHSASFAEKYIDNDLPLIITNCDQQMYWDPSKFISFIEQNDPDGVVVVTKSNDPKHSYALFNNHGVVGSIAEKRIISEYGLTGIHYWKKPSDFFASFNDSRLTYKDEGYPELYVSITYNKLIQVGKKIMAYVIENDEFVPIGVPEQVENFVSR